MSHPIPPALRAGRIGWDIFQFSKRFQKFHPTFAASFQKKNSEKNILKILFQTSGI